MPCARAYEPVAAAVNYSSAGGAASMPGMATGPNPTTAAALRRESVRRVGGLLRSTLEAPGRLLFPHACRACGGELAGEADPLSVCDACLAELRLTQGPACPRCAAPAVALGAGRLAPCGSCQDARFRFDAAHAAGEYGGLLRTLVLEAKHAAGEATALLLGSIVWSATGGALAGVGADVVCAVPMHWRRRLLRQTNSPELIAEVVADRLAAPFAPRLLRRTRATTPQTELARSLRLPNVRRAFALRRGYRLAGATVLLIDDILTTGATCNEASRALLEAGAGRVVVVVAARSL
ncbi:MAG: double zinc ribbon domain-containing protein [Planctomycetota bacterium]